MQGEDHGVEGTNNEPNVIQDDNMQYASTFPDIFCIIYFFEKFYS